MAQVANTWSGLLDDGDPADGGVVETALDALRAGINEVDASQIASGANIDGADLLDASVTEAKMDRTSTKTLRTNASGIIMMTGSKTVVVANGTASKTETVTFSSDADDYTADFSSTTGLRILVSIFADTSPAEAMTVETDAHAVDSFDVKVRTGDDGNVGADRTVAVHWIAIGPA